MITSASGINIARAELRGRGHASEEIPMHTRVLGLTISAVILAYGTVGSLAQDRMMPQPVQQQAQSQPTDQEGSGMMGRGGMMAGGTMGHGMIGGPPPVMLRIMFALIDTDSDGTISLQEFQAAHERIFKAMDTNKDGKLTLEEMQAFIHGTR
jgi:hypothetical protein